MEPDVWSQIRISRQIWSPWQLADRGEVNILAVVHNTASDQGVGALSVLNRYYGRDDIPLGAYQGRIGLPNKNYQSPWGFTRVPPQAAWQVGPYVGDLVATFPSRIRNASQAYDATALLRLVLSAASGKSVTVVSVGYATNLLNLLESSSDSMSVLTGQALVSQKVKQLVMMGGRHQFHPGDPVEWNLAGATWQVHTARRGFAVRRREACTPAKCASTCSPPPSHVLLLAPYSQASVCGGACGESNNLGRITNRTLAMWPQETRLVFLDFETGVDVWVGDVLRFGAPHSFPCRRAYEVFCRINVGWCHLMSRCSWDIMALVFAVRGAESFYSAEAGHNEVDPLTGHNTWVAARPGTASNNEFSLMLPVELYGAVEKEINALLLQRPLLETTGLEVREGKEEEVALQRPLLETTGLEVREGKEEEVAGEDVADQAAVAAAEEEVNLVGEEIDTGGVDMETREAVDLITKAGLAAKSITKLPPRSVGMVVLSILTAAIMAAMCTCFALATLWVTMSGRLAHLRRELKVSSERRETEGARLVQEYESI